ncbi:MAG: hypothetical protein HY821_08615 [Acidobacteria bacterium]|nr:hypothetical protein [Acidobacteriota bacterium]
MAIYRYRPETIDPLCRSIQKRHGGMFVAVVAVVVTTGFFAMPRRDALIGGALFATSVLGTFLATRKSGLRRTAELVRRVELEIGEQRITLRNAAGAKALERADVTDAYFTAGSIWLRGKPRARLIPIPGELEAFDTLGPLLQSWIPDSAIRHDTLPSTRWRTAAHWGAWIAAAILFFISLASDRVVLVAPASLLLAIAIPWYFTWCGKAIKERKWRILLPLTGYVLAASLCLKPATMLLIAWLQ